MPYREAGVFTANGSGSLTTVTDDFSEGSSVGTTISTGTYGINNDGTGTLSLNNVLGHRQLEVTLVSASKIYLMEVDSPSERGRTGREAELDGDCEPFPPALLFSASTISTP